MDAKREILESVVNGLFDSVYFVDLDKKITFWNEAANELTGFKGSEVIGSRCCDKILAHMDRQANIICYSECPLAKTLADGRERETDLFLRHKDGHRIRTTVRTKPILDPKGNIVGAMEIFRERPLDEAVEQKMNQLHELALLDPLTRLANRRHTENTLELRLHEMERYVWAFGVLFIDIDHFKEINDQHGHQAGDTVLELSAKTMLSSLRPFDFLGRWGGEEFVAIVVNVDENQLYQVANRTRQLMDSSHVSIGTENLHVTVSIGATMAQKGDTLKDLLSRADRLMYESKKRGRNRVSTAPPPPNSFFERFGKSIF